MLADSGFRKSVADLMQIKQLVAQTPGWFGQTYPQSALTTVAYFSLAVLERARSFMQQSGQTFEVALAVTRAGNLFTTHTAVAAGFDRFEPCLAEHYLGEYARTELGITLYDLLAMGRQDPNDASENFNMGYLGHEGVAVPLEANQILWQQ